jgi:putative acetyltransferase
LLARATGKGQAVEVTIRAYDPRDAAGLAEVFYRSVREAALADYTPAQVEAWLPARPDPSLMAQRAGDGRLVLVAADGEDRVVGYIELEPDGHIDHLYCAPEAVGRGVASRLYDTLETAARNQRIGRLYVEASEAARRLFARKGFTLVRRQDLVRHGVGLHNYIMFKHLGPGDGPGTGVELPCRCGVSVVEKLITYGNAT